MLYAGQYGASCALNANIPEDGAACDSYWQLRTGMTPLLMHCALLFRVSSLSTSTWPFLMASAGVYWYYGFAWLNIYRTQQAICTSRARCHSSIFANLLA